MNGLLLAQSIRLRARACSLFCDVSLSCKLCLPPWPLGCQSPSCLEKLMEAAQPTEFFEPEHYFV